MRNFRPRNQNKKRGFSLMEAIIALAIIVMIGGATLTLVLSSVKVENATAVKMNAVNDAQNAVECFRYARDNGTDLETLLQKAGVIDENAAQENGQYETEKVGYTLILTVQGNNGIRVVAKNGEATVYELTYGEME